ncbi:MAG TPA: hypothetical protein VGH15_05660 [Caulobacteraceae bacterium]|jgi:hypothetical protein
MSRVLMVVSAHAGVVHLWPTERTGAGVTYGDPLLFKMSPQDADDLAADLAEFAGLARERPQATWP